MFLCSTLVPASLLWVLTKAVTTSRQKNLVRGGTVVDSLLCSTDTLLMK